jgi:DnaJ domain
MYYYPPKTIPVNRALVALTRRDGSIMTVSVKLSMTNRIADLLNGPDQFLDILTPEGEQLFVAKSDIAGVRLVNVPRANQLNLQRRYWDKATFDPYAVLRIPKGASPDEIRQAYNQMTWLYHPDRLSALELPEEMTKYASVMQVRINLAYEQIGR